MLLNKKNFSAEQIGVFFGLFSLFLYLISSFLYAYSFALFLIPIFLSTLAYERRTGIIATCVLTTGIFLLQPFPAFVRHFTSYIFPAITLGWMSMRYIKIDGKIWWYPESRILRDITCVTIFSTIFLSTSVLKENHIQDLVGQLQTITGLSINPIIKNASVGISTLFNTVFVLINYRLAYLIAKKKKILVRKNFDFYNLTLPRALAVLPILLLVTLQIFKSHAFLITGALISSMIAPFLHSLSIVHCIAKKKKRSLIVFYVVFFLIFTPMFLTLTLLGIVAGMTKAKPWQE